MNLMRFEEQVDSELLRVAKEWYEQGLALRVHQTFNDRYTVWLSDSLDVHIVNVTVSDFYDIFYNHCDCSLDREYKCVHQIVALFAVRDYFNYDHLIWNFDSYKDKLEEKLIDIPKRDLVDRLLRMIKKDPSITKKLFLENENEETQSSAS